MLLTVWLHGGLLIVDHIHFQYNGFLLGIFLLSLVQLSNVRSQSNHYLRDQDHAYRGAFLFTILLTLKHLYACFIPAVFFFLLRFHCFRGSQFSFTKFLGLGLIVFITFGTLLSPCIRSTEDARQLWARLFPFERGLMHSYWAANVWAMYGAIDIALAHGTTMTNPRN